MLRAPAPRVAACPETGCDRQLPVTCRSLQYSRSHVPTTARIAELFHYIQATYIEYLNSGTGLAGRGRMPPMNREQARRGRRLIEWSSAAGAGRVARGSGGDIISGCLSSVVAGSVPASPGQTRYISRPPVGQRLGAGSAAAAHAAASGAAQGSAAAQPTVRCRYRPWENPGPAQPV